MAHSQRSRPLDEDQAEHIIIAGVLKFIGGAIGVVFLIGLLLVIGLLALIF